VHIREREEPGGIFTDAFIQAESSVGVKLVLANLAEEISVGPGPLLQVMPPVEGHQVKIIQPPQWLQCSQDKWWVAVWGEQFNSAGVDVS
jgi:hypothetical protein